MSKWDPLRKGQNVVNCDDNVSTVDEKITTEVVYVVRDDRGYPVTVGSVRLSFVEKSSEAELGTIGLGLLECMRHNCE